MNILAISAILTGALAGTAGATLQPEAANFEVPCPQPYSGDRVGLAIHDWAASGFRVAETDLQHGYVIGRIERVRIADVAAAEGRARCMGTTALLVGGMSCSVFASVLILSAPVLIPGGGQTARPPGSVPSRAFPFGADDFSMVEVNYGA